MANSLTQTEYNEIELLVNHAISAYSKKEASKQLSRLRFMANTLDLAPNIHYMFSELIGYTDAATGRVREKDHWVSAARSALYKMKSYGLRREETIDE